MSDSRLISILKRVRRRQLLVGNTAGVLWAVVASAVVLLVGMWLDLLWELSPQVRIVASVASALAGLLLLAWLGARLAMLMRRGSSTARAASAARSSAVGSYCPKQSQIRVKQTRR